MNIEKKNKIKKRYLKVLFFIPIVVLGVIFMYEQKIKVDKGNNLENEMTTMVSSFYDKNIKGKVTGINRQVITLEDLQKGSYDISKFLNAKCKIESFSYIILENPQETDVKKIKYTIENHLDCN